MHLFYCKLKKRGARLERESGYFSSGWGVYFAFAVAAGRLREREKDKGRPSNCVRIAVANCTRQQQKWNRKPAVAFCFFLRRRKYYWRHRRRRHWKLLLLFVGRTHISVEREFSSQKTGLTLHHIYTSIVLISTWRTPSTFSLPSARPYRSNPTTKTGASLSPPLPVWWLPGCTLI